MAYTCTNMRTKAIYGNCEVYAPDGHLMFRCQDDRINWYLKKNLAVKLSDSPLAIRLTFTPKGNGEPVEALRIKRENHCVVCGEKEISKLTRHHLVPYEYRKHFPIKYKKHSSLFVLPLCEECHRSYEQKFAEEFKKQIETDLGLNSPELLLRIVAAKLLKNLIDGINKRKNLKQAFYDKIASSCIATGYKFDQDKIKANDIEYIQSCVDQLCPNPAIISMSRGEAVVSRIADYKVFSLTWVKHFMDSMKPPFIHEDFNHEVISKAFDSSLAKMQ